MRCSAESGIPPAVSEPVPPSPDRPAGAPDRAPVSHNLAEWIAGWARVRGDAPALDDPDRRLTYLELEARVARLAGHLADQGVERGDRVGILLANRTAYLEGLAAAARLGAIALPINTRLSPRELAYILGDAEPRALFFERSLEDLADAALERSGLVHCARQPVGAGDGPGDPKDTADAADDPYEAALAAAPAPPPVVTGRPDDPMMLMYTSGTTGVPKGALLPHRKALANCRNAEIFFGIEPRDRVLVVAPLFHSLGLQILSLPVLYAGGSLVLRRGFDPEALWADVGGEGITYLGGVPTMYQRLHAALEAGAAADTRGLRFLFTAGSAIPVELIHAFEKRGLVLKQGYGQTETSILCCLDAADALRKAGSVGRPVAHGELRIVASDGIEEPAETWRDTAPGETGEIVVRGELTMLGYWRQPEATAETLREDGWLRTGDLARMDEEGFVTLAGRARDMYISGGENVYPAEVESVYEEHPAVREIAVVGVPDERWGEVGRAHVVLAEGAVLDAEALTLWGAERLARFKLPVAWVAERALPRTETGKVQKHRLQASGADGADAAE